MAGLRSLALLLLLAACGTGEDNGADPGSGSNGPPVCNLADTAPTLVSTATPCPPERCVIDPEEGATTCQGKAVAQGGQACTAFVVAGDACDPICAPPTCTLSPGGVVTCAPGCSADQTTCYAVADDACPAAALR